MLAQQQLAVQRPSLQRRTYHEFVAKLVERGEVTQQTFLQPVVWLAFCETQLYRQRWRRIVSPQLADACNVLPIVCIGSL